MLHFKSSIVSLLLLSSSFGWAAPSSDVVAEISFNSNNPMPSINFPGIGNMDNVVNSIMGSVMNELAASNSASHSPIRIITAGIRPVQERRTTLVPATSAADGSSSLTVEESYSWSSSNGGVASLESIPASTGATAAAKEQDEKDGGFFSGMASYLKEHQILLWLFIAFASILFLALLALFSLLAYEIITVVWHATRATAIVTSGYSTVPIMDNDEEKGIENCPTYEETIIFKGEH